MAFARILPSVRRERPCGAKRAYATRYRAIVALQALLKDYNVPDAREYQCQDCNQYHLGQASAQAN